MTKSENNGIIISNRLSTATSTGSNSSLRIYTFAALQVQMDCNVFDYLAGQYAKRYNSDVVAGRDHMNSILDQMKIAPKITYGRVNYLQATNNSAAYELKDELENALDCKDRINFHPKYFDCIVIPPLRIASAALTCTMKPKFTRKSTTNASNGSTSPWPQHQRVILVDRYCGEAVLRGAHIYVRGILCADVGIQPKELVAVYVHLDGHYTRGCDISTFHQGSCVFLGVGEAICSRSQMFSLSHGLAVRMMIPPQLDDEAYYHPPSLPSTVTEGKFMLQNFPSIVTTHALLHDIIREKDTLQRSINHENNKIVILDMCCAPGGKTSHIASLLQRFYSDNFLIVACDKSRKKISEMKVFLQNMNATTCVVPLVTDSTNLLVLPNDSTSSTNTNHATDPSWPSVYEVLSTCSKLLTSSNNDANNSDVTEHHDNESFKGFYPESFDRILLDPPCSALGLRPKLRVELTLQQLQRFPKYQKRLVRNAVSLLKVGGILTYSTCTIHAEENEGMCYHILHKYPNMKLLPIDKDNQKEDKQWGLPGFGLSDDERRCVKRYDPSLEDTVGFFIAKFIKISSDIKHISRE